MGYPWPTFGSPAAFLTWIHVPVPVQRGELLPVVPYHGVARVALVRAQAQPVEFALGLQAEAAVLCIDLLVAPVLQLNQQSVIILIGEHVDIF